VDQSRNVGPCPYGAGVSDQPENASRGGAARRVVPHTHDGVFRLVFGKPAHAASQLRAVLPPGLTARLDLDRLTPIDGSFVDTALSWRHCDVLLRTRLDGRDALIYVILEHQSTPDPLMAWRMLRYLVRIWERHLSDHPNATRLPVIVPIVVYQGRRAWSGPLELHDLLDLDPDIAEAAGPLLPRFRFLLDDLSGVEETELRARPLTPAARLTFFLLSAAPGNPDVAADLTRWLDTLAEAIRRPDGIEILQALLAYIHYVSETPTQKLHHVITQLGPDAEEAYVTTADMLRAEDRAETLARLMTLKFGALPDSAQARLQAASAEQLATWIDRVLTATTLDEIFA
jgi:predicted transposase/invertase (TIGR01784 family)